MTTLSKSALVDLSLDINWEKDGIRHSDRYFADQLNCWRDIFPGSPLEILFARDIDRTISVHVKPGDIVPAPSEKKVICLPKNRLRSDLAPGRVRFAGFYPQGMISGHAKIFNGNMTPFRCIEKGQDHIKADLNHPMAGIPFTLKMNVLNQRIRANEHGGSCTDWIDLALSGPGMQTRITGRPWDFSSDGFFDRRDPGPDSDFYARNRFVHHIDSRARQELKAIYRRVVHPKDKVLDLMAGWESHIPDDPGPGYIHGVGLNVNELITNPALSAHTVQDLNTTPCLAFNDHEFDGVVCSLSVEYLTNPMAVFKEVARILKPGGTFAVTFSNRWFPEKAIGIWKDLHDFERMGLVTEYFIESGRYDRISTISSRGYPRPHDDPYFPQSRQSDPLYAVIGQTRNP